MTAQRSHTDRRDQYHKILRIVEYQTGGEQSALAPQSSIRIVASHAGMDKEDARKRIQAAIENGDLLEWHGQLAIVDEANIEAVRDEALYIEGVIPGDLLALTRRRVLREGRFDDGEVWCLVDTETLEAMARSPNAHPDSNYLAEERSLEVLLAPEDGLVLRNNGTGEHVVFLDPASVTLDHGLLDPSRVAILEVNE